MICFNQCRGSTLVDLILCMFGWLGDLCTTRTRILSYKTSSNCSSRAVIFNGPVPTVPLVFALNDSLKPQGSFRQAPAIEAPLANIFSPTEWLRHLAEEFEQHGLIHTRNVDRPPVPWLSKQDTDNAIWALADIHEGLKLRAAKEVSEKSGRQ